MCEDALVTAKTVVDQIGIPRTTLYRLAESGRIPARDVTQPWHQRRRFLFCVEEVRAALGERGRPRRPPPDA